MTIILAKKIDVNFSIAIVVSRFNQQVTQALLDGATKRLKALGIPDQNFLIAWVSGSVEIPIVAQQLAKTDKYEAIICLGAVIQGETDHYDYVCQQVSYGCQRVALHTNIPIIFGVLTTQTEQQALDRAGGKAGNRGEDAVDTAIDMISVLRQIKLIHEC